MIERPKMNFQLKKTQDVPIDMGTNFSIVCALMNPGDKDWPPLVSLDFVGGEKFSGPSEIPLPSLGAGKSIEFSINLQAPFQSGMHYGSWMMCAKGDYSVMFGDPIWVTLNVNESSNMDFGSHPLNLGSNMEMGSQPLNLESYTPQQIFDVNQSYLSQFENYNGYESFNSYNNPQTNTSGSGYSFGKIYTDNKDIMDMNPEENK